jgi:hypothetical protein
MIKSGDVFQILMSNRFTQKAIVDHLSFYRALRSKNPSPYLFLLEFENFTIAGSSPEVMVRLGFVHGGFRSKNGLGYEAYETDYYWDRDLWGLALLQHSNFQKDSIENFKRFEKHKEIYIGHTSTGYSLIKPHLPEYQYSEQPKQGRIITPMNRCNVWNLDTGGGYEGKLTIMDVETKEFWQSDFVNTLYPDERGRN